MRQTDPTMIERAAWGMQPKVAAPTAGTGPVAGFDISKWTVITNAAQALAGMTFAIIRARDGIRDDSAWGTNKALAKQLPFWGAYAFFNPRFLTNEADGGGAQAAAFLALTKPSREFDGLNVPLVIDCENSPGFTIPPASRYLHELKYYVEAMVAGMGRKPVVYSNLSFFDSYLEAHVDKPTSTWEAERDKSWLRSCPLCIARPTAAAAPTLPKAWSRWAFWQYKLDNANHPGLSVTDENYWAGTIEQLRAWCLSDSAPIPVWGEVVPPPPPPPPPPPVDPDAWRASVEARLAALEAKAHSTHTTTGA